MSADPIIVHPDVRKTLLKMKSLNEGIRALLHLQHFKLMWQNMRKINLKNKELMTG